MGKRNGRLVYASRREEKRPQTEKMYCTMKPDCAGCPFPSHGFVCWSTDGSCLRTYMKKLQKGGRVP